MKSYWIWNCGDFELFHSNLVNCRRQQYGADYPPFWKLYDVERNVHFYAEKNIEQNGTMVLHLNGKGCIRIDEVRYPSNVEIKLTAGRHKFQIDMFNLTGLPAAFIESDVVATDGGWYTQIGDGEPISVGFDEAYTTKEDNPEQFHFAYERKDYVVREEVDGGILFDFGKELFGFLYVSRVTAADKLHVSYGESREEALDLTRAIVQEDVCGCENYQLRQRAFRYIYITGAADPEVYAELEYLPLAQRGSFECDNQTVNDVWNMCAYTLKLNAREVYTEAVKRDRWLWGGDAYQTFKFSKYLYFDKEIVRRSLIGLRGKEPFDEHINTITDYSLYWVIALWEYYQTYGDEAFIRFIYPRAVSLMAFCKKRTNEHGFIIGKGKDWLFIDWAKEIDKSGVICAEQMLYAEALTCMYRLSQLIGQEEAGYLEQAEVLKQKVNAFFWNEEKGAYIDNYESDTVNVTRHANVFAVLYDIADEAQKQSIVQKVLLNNEIPPITTPYFEGYELDAMGKVGNMQYIYDMITSYWKGMMDLGATTVWEEFNPQLSGIEHYAMYGDKFQKSLCHAWGASPIYLLGKYYLGVEETAAGYESFKVQPQLGAFEYIKGCVPIRGGEVRVFLSKEKLSVKTDRPGGVLIWNNRTYELKPHVELVL